jgi:hypothetical protein
MLVEDSDLSKVIPCLLCKTAIKVAGPPPTQAPPAGAPPPVRR